MRELVEKSIVFVSAKATLGNAKAVMGKKRIVKMCLSPKMVNQRNQLLGGYRIPKFQNILEREIEG